METPESPAACHVLQAINPFHAKLSAYIGPDSDSNNFHHTRLLYPLQANDGKFCRTSNPRPNPLQ